MDDIELIITGSERDLGGFHVRRVLPYPQHRMVGPFIFFDHMGPADLAVNEGIDVLPHPHMNLATVTYLFEGAIRHRDSLGSDQLILPGAINWMVAGHGIVHSERTPLELRNTGSRLNGVQCWIALPEEFEEIAPSFSHHAADDLPEFSIGDVQLKLLLGSAFGHQSPVKVHSKLFYTSINMPKGAELNFPFEGSEGALYTIDGCVLVNEVRINQYTMAVGKKCGQFTIKALEDSRLMLLGGSPLGPRHIFWNFVSSNKDKIEKAKSEWLLGPGHPQSRFRKIPFDDEEFIPLPKPQQVNLNPKGSIM